MTYDPEHSRNPMRNAFSLVELIVVLGMVSLLTSLLMPALHQARLMAQQAQCASNLRQLGVALYIYSNNNQGNLPRYDYWHTYPEGKLDDGAGPGWTELLMPYYEPPDSPVYHCPSFEPQYPCNYFIEARWERQNDLFTMKLSNVRQPSLFVLSGDCTHQRFYAAPFGILQPVFLDSWDCDKDDAVIDCLAFGNKDMGRNMHPGGNNVLFADDHVQAFTKYDPAFMTYNPQGSRSVAWDDVVRDPKLGPIPPPPGY